MTGKTARPRKATAAADIPADPLARPDSAAAVLLPDEEIEIADPETGEAIAVKVREYRFLEGLEAQAIGADLIADLARYAGAEDRPSAGAGDMTPSVMMSVLGRHREAWLALCALSTGRAADWLASLREPDSFRVSSAVWSVNQSFFITRVLTEHLGASRMRETWGSLTSSTHFAPPVTDPPET